MKIFELLLKCDQHFYSIVTEIKDEALLRCANDASVVTRCAKAHFAQEKHTPLFIHATFI